METCTLISVFVLWTVTSFLCHFTGRLFLNSETENEAWYKFIKAFVLTFHQTVMCYCLTNIKLRSDKIFLSLSVCHFLATLSTNYSMALMFASSTFAIKLMEPITSACVQRLLLAIPLHPSILVSLPLIVFGACMFAGNPLTDTSMSKGTVMAFLSNVILAVRNVAIKTDQNNYTILNLRSISFLIVVITFHAVFVAVIFLKDTHNSDGKYVLTYSIAFMVLSSVFHVIYSYISTSIVLRYMSVLSHSVCNIMKRVLVVVLLYIVGSRHASLNNFLGLGVSTVGLFLYVGFKSSVKNSRNVIIAHAESGDE